MMPLHRDLLRAVTVACLVATALVATSAQAATTVTTDTSRPGHVVATVATDAAYVRAWLEEGSEQVLTPVPEPVVDGTATVDLETWGLAAPVLVTVSCTSAEAGTCEAPVRTPFTPSDVQPAVTWSEDPVVRAGESYDISVQDPRGGGRLAIDSTGCHLRPLQRTGTTAVAFESCWRDGDHEVRVLRCQDVATWRCVPTGIVHTVRLNQRFYSAVQWVSPAVVSPDDGPDLTAFVSTDDSAPVYSVSWRAVSGSAELSSGTATVSRDANGLLPVPVDVGEAQNGSTIDLHGTVSYTEADGGPVTGAFLWRSIHIDTNAPVVKRFELSASTVYPVKGDHYVDRVELKVRVRDASGYSGSVITVRDEEGVVVRQGRYSSWDGRNDLGRIVPEGSYRLSRTFTDAAGNATEASVPVRVSHEQLVERTVTRSVTAAASLRDRWTGACSSVRKPAPGRGAGSLALQSNTTCGGTSWNRSAVVTVHDVVLPRATFHDYIQVLPIGGASATHPGSRAYFQFWDARHGDWLRYKRLGADFGLHSVPGRDDVPDLALGDRVAWRVYTGGGARYDLTAFRVTLKYRVLV